MAVGKIKTIEKTNTHYSISFDTGEEARLYVLNNHVFRYYMSPANIFFEHPKPINKDDVARITAKTTDEYGYDILLQSLLDEIESHYIINTNDVHILFDKEMGTMKILDNRTNKEVLHEAAPLSYKDFKSTQTLHNRNDEYFFGGGTQNGRFSHKGEVIEIVNTNNWTDGGVSSPCPFYWSTYGYGVLRNTWQKGQYDFGKKQFDIVETVHDGEDFDAYLFINSSPRDILQDYYELTGKPLLLPQYALYEAHFNAFNRDYWVEVSGQSSGAIFFEDGKYYKSYKPEDLGGKEGILESLNGEKDNYQFSARAMIDRYKKHDMPLGWFIPNDGYGSGYGQTDSLDGDIQNLRQFSDYCHENDIKLALWTESNLHPKDPSNPQKGERDLKKEVCEANVVALKCDVAWIGSGYSFALNAIEYAANVFTEETKSEIRPMILTVDGWAGTQRCASIWTGDQKGGEWEYIRFHIPTYIGTGLSGQPNIGSDMDGIYYGGDKNVNIRDYQWKAFTPLQLNMDGWGNIPKTPFSFDDEATVINRAYLKLKSMLLPYNYSICFESTKGLPMVRAMFLEFPNESCAYTLESQYQYMWGPNILVAPIYNGITSMETSLRDGIYLPDKNQLWIDFFTGEKFQGGKIYNNIVMPIWKIPVFIKEGCIIPMTNANNNPSEVARDERIFTIYPKDQQTFNVYEDDGISLDYQKGLCTSTIIDANKLTSCDLLLKIHKTTGTYKNMVKEKMTLLQILVSKDVEFIKGTTNGKSVSISKAETYEQFESDDNSYFFDEHFTINPYLTKYGITQKMLLIKISKLDVTTNEIMIKITNIENEKPVFGYISTVNDELLQPVDFEEDITKKTSTCTNLKWKTNHTVDYYEIERDGNIYSNIKGNTFNFEHTKDYTKMKFRIRAIVGNIASNWSDILEIFPL